MFPRLFLNPRKVTCTICGKEFEDFEELSCTDIQNFMPVCPGCKFKNRGKDRFFPLQEKAEDKDISD